MKSTPDQTSPWNLLQEELRHEPWKLLVGCIMLNQTSFKQVRPIIWSFFERFPTPDDLAVANHDELAMMLKPLGFYNRRAERLTRFASEFITGDWERPEELYGIGKYGADSYNIFVLGHLDEVEPTDKKLLAYKAWANGDPNASDALHR